MCLRSATRHSRNRLGSLGGFAVVLAAVLTAAPAQGASERAHRRRPDALHATLVETVRDLAVNSGTVAAEVDIELSSTVVARGGTGMIGATLRAPEAQVIASLNDMVFPGGGEVVIPARMLMAVLAADIGATDLEIPLQAGQGKSLPSFGIVSIEGEIIYYSGVVDDVLIVASRGVPAAAHPAGAAVFVPTETPDCEAHPALEGIGKSAAFAFLPDSCTPRPLACNDEPGCDPQSEACCCLGVRAIVIGLADLDPIPDGTPLYECKVQAGESAGAFPLVCPEGPGVEPPFQRAMSGSSPLSTEPPAYETICTDSNVTVAATNDVHLVVGSANVAPGGQATVTVRLHTLGTSVSGVRNDIGFDAGAAIAERETEVTTLSGDVGAEDLLLPIVDGNELPESGLVRIDDETIAYESRTENQLMVATRGALDTAAAPHLSGAPVLLRDAIPDCETSPELLVAGYEVVFAFLSEPCSPGIDCDTIRAIVLSFGGAPIADGTPLYSCRIQAGKVQGTFPLTCSMSEALSPPPKSQPLPASCEEGRVVVGSASTPTATPTVTATNIPSTPTPSSTPIPPTATFTARTEATATPTPVPLQGDCDRDGCVDLGEVVFGVGVALGSSVVDECPALDDNDDGAATIDELIAAVDNSVNGCEKR